MAFDKLLGQETAIRLLKDDLDSGRIHHAYLFTGKKGVGKGLWLWSLPGPSLSWAGRGSLWQLSGLPEDRPFQPPGLKYCQDQ